MSLYAEQIFPRLMDWVLRKPAFQDLRRDVLSQVRGDVLEIGFGTGLNLPFYPPTVSWLTVLDPTKMLPDRVAQRLASASLPVQMFPVSAEALPFEALRFDYVVSTWTLCSIRDVGAALHEVRRVLKPDGKLVFLEHGRSLDPRVARWQDRLNPLQRLLACGCHLNRRIDQVIAEAGLNLEKLDRFVMPDVPRLGADMYRGVASPLTALR